MEIVIAGGSGFIGSELVHFLRDRGYAVKKLVRRMPANPFEIMWDPAKGILDPACLAKTDAVINLSGENIARKRWSKEEKKEILQSRLGATQTLVNAIQALSQKPKIFISASAIGYYGVESNIEADETAAAGHDFLAEVCRQWEEAVKPLENHLRVVWLRNGVVLSKSGGVLAKMLLPFKLGLGGIAGDGKQIISWIDMDDLLQIAAFAIEQPALAGPINAVAPHPVTNEEYTKTLAALLHRPALLPLPAFAVKLVLGEMGEYLLLKGRPVIPQKILAAGFKFKYPTLQDSLTHILNS